MYDFMKPIVARPTEAANERSISLMESHEFRPKSVLPSFLKGMASLNVLNTCTYMECRKCDKYVFIPNDHFKLENA